MLRKQRSLYKRPSKIHRAKQWENINAFNKGYSDICKYYPASNRHDEKSGVNAKAAQIDRGEFVEFIVRIPKREHSMKRAQ